MPQHKTKHSLLTLLLFISLVTYSFAAGLNESIHQPGENPKWFKNCILILLLINKFYCKCGKRTCHRKIHGPCH